jgi:outer membrane lipoprotein-sorting protein
MNGMKFFPLTFTAVLPITLVCSALRIAGGCLPAHLAVAPQAEPVTLDSVLKKMDDAAAKFRTAQAALEWDSYQKVIDEVDQIETGTIYYRRNGKDNDIEMKVDIKELGSSLSSMKPAPKSVLLNEGKIRVYEPKRDQVTVYDPGKNRAEFESYAVLGFGGSGQDLLKSFDVKYAGQQPINGVSAAWLQLTPKSPKVRNTYKRIDLWIDLDKGVSIQQQFFTPENDYRLCKYSNVRVNEKIPDNAFKLNTTGKTQVVTQGG